MHSKHHPWVDVAVFADVNDANLFQTFLKSKNFDARVFNDRWLQRFLFLCPPRATFRVQVHQDIFKGVQDLLGGENAPEILRTAIRCPECDSLHIQYPQMTRKFLLPTIFLHLGIIFRIIEHEAYCENCHHTWNLPKENR